MRSKLDHTLQPFDLCFLAQILTLYISLNLLISMIEFKLSGFLFHIDPWFFVSYFPSCLLLNYVVILQRWFYFRDIPQGFLWFWQLLSGSWCPCCEFRSHLTELIWRCERKCYHSASTLLSRVEVAHTPSENTILPSPQRPLFPLCRHLKRTLCYHIPDFPELPFWVDLSLSRSSLCPEGLLHGSYTRLLGWTSSDSVCREMLYFSLILQGCFVFLCL